MTLDRPLLDGVRVLDLGDAVGEAATRLLADLGAHVVKLEPAGGSPLRAGAPVVDGVSLPFALRNAGKRSVVGDPATDPEHVRQLASTSDIVVLSREAAAAVDADRLSQDHPHLVVVVSSPFGRLGPHSDWQATERTLLALSGSLSRSGSPGSAPLLPPDGIAESTAAAQTAWTAVVAYTSRLRSGLGQIVDLSHHEAVVTGLDPAFGVQGSAAAGRAGGFRRGRPPADSYPIYPCADGFVRLCLLAKRQWRSMYEWLGSPGEFADPSYDSISARVAAADRLDPLIEALFQSNTASELVEEAARRGIPLSEVLTLGDAVHADHFVKTGTVEETELSAGVRANVPTGFARVDGVRIGLRAPAPSAPTDTRQPIWSEPRSPVRSSEAAGAPFSGLRVLDLGVIVFGAEAGRAFADLGAEVIKVESRAFPDGLRQTRGGEAMNASFAWGHRGRRSIGLDLRRDEGRALFLRLVRESDVVLSNFKPGTMDSLGLGYVELSTVNPRIVLLESAAFSSGGPWSHRLGYGPLVRAACGVSSLWKYDASETESWDGVTVFPDHVAARLAALTIAAALIARGVDGRGRHIEVAQADVVLHQLAAYAAWEDLEPGSVGAARNRGRHLFGGVFACAGDDEWCVVDARDDVELQKLTTFVQAPPGTSVENLEPYVAAWAATRSPFTATNELQAQGLPGAGMVRLPELVDDPQLSFRGTYTAMRHPLLESSLPAEDVTAPYQQLVAVEHEPAPLSGQNTVEVCRDVLGMSEAEIESLLQRDVLHQ